MGKAARPTDEELEFVSAMHAKTRQPKTSGEIPFGEEKTTFHGTAERDYLGRTYMAVPQDLDVNLLGEPGTQPSFVPKKCIHTWSGHTRGVSAIRFLPGSAHLLLSAGMDNKIKVRYGLPACPQTKKRSPNKLITFFFFWVDLGRISR
jgi:pre-mRNA-processing factor 17